MKDIMTHLVYAYPSIDESAEIYKVLARYSKYIEIQIPFSDPIADWKVIAEANEVALQHWTSTNDVFDFINTKSHELSTKVLIMCYYHTIFQYGIRAFVQKAKQVGTYWLIVPDLPIDSADGYIFNQECIDVWINPIITVSPNTRNERLMHLSKYVRGFVYAISQNTTTGNAGNFRDEQFLEYIKRLREYFTSQIWVGFWVQTPDDVEAVNSVADFSIIGSQLIRIYNKQWLDWLEQYMKSLPF